MLSIRKNTVLNMRANPKKATTALHVLQPYCLNKNFHICFYTYSFTYTYTDTPFDIAQVPKAWESQVAKGYMVPWCSGITSVLKHAENLDVNICYICYRCLHCIYNWIYTKHLLDVSCFWKRTNIYQQLALILLLWPGIWVCGVLHCESIPQKRK